MSTLKVDTIQAESAAAVAVSDALTVSETLVVTGAVTITSGTITGITDLTVADGGTGVSTLADGGLVVGNAAAAVEVVAAGATTEILVGGGAATNPVWTTATGSGAPVRATSPTLVTPVLGAASATSLTLTNDLPVTEGGTGASTAADARTNLGIVAPDAQGDVAIGYDGSTANSLQFPLGGAHVINGKIAFSVAAGALTIALKGLDGSDPSATNAVFVRLPQGNPQDGTYSIRRINSATSLVISSGSTLGHASTVASPVYVYFIDNSGTLELAASNKFFGQFAVVSTSAEGGAGGADSATTLYSTSARSDVPAAVLLRWKSTQTTAGTWAATTGEVQLYPFPWKTPSVQVFTNTGANTYTKPWDLLSAKVEVQAGGGGGGGADSDAADNVAAGGGGGGGGYSRRYLAADAIGPTETTTVGAGGAAGAGSGGNGGTGDTSSFGSLLSATGGSGGTGEAVGAPTSAEVGGNGGVGSSGDVNIRGGDGSGGFGHDDATNLPVVRGGTGGNSVLGGGGRGACFIIDTTTGIGSDGNEYGGGGGGGGAAGSVSSGGGTGGAGAQGIVIVEEFYI